MRSCVKWAGGYSRSFRIGQGVRQGALLSPLLYTLFIDDLLDTLESEGLGLHINSIFCGSPINIICNSSGHSATNDISSVYVGEPQFVKYELSYVVRCISSSMSMRHTDSAYYSVCMLIAARYAYNCTRFGNYSGQLWLKKLSVIGHM